MLIVLYRTPDGNCASMSTADATPTAIASMLHEIIAEGCDILDFFTEMWQLEASGLVAISEPRKYSPEEDIIVRNYCPPS